MAGSCATDACEPCQVLTEAALSESVCVPRVCLAGATGKRTVRRGAFKEWVHGFFKKFSVIFLMTLFFYTLNRLLCPAGAKFFRLWLQAALFFVRKTSFRARQKPILLPAMAASGAVFLYVKNGFRSRQGLKSFRLWLQAALFFCAVKTALVSGRSPLLLPAIAASGAVFCTLKTASAPGRGQLFSSCKRR